MKASLFNKMWLGPFEVSTCLKTNIYLRVLLMWIFLQLPFHLIVLTRHSNACLFRKKFCAYRLVILERERECGANTVFMQQDRSTVKCYCCVGQTNSINNIETHSLGSKQYLAICLKRLIFLFLIYLFFYFPCICVLHPNWTKLVFLL